MTRRPKAKTAYELLQQVCVHILEEPKRYHQAYWGDEGSVLDELPQPACGTVCCRAGWIVALHDGPEAVKKGNSGLRANEILGLTDDETDTIYYDNSMEHLRQGTTAYAEAGVAGLRRWMKQHEAHLKARSLEGV